MLKIMTEYGNMELEASGTTSELTADVLLLIRTIYRKLDKRVREEFKKRMLELLPTVFDEDLEGLFKKTSEELKEELSSEEMDSLIESLEDLKNALKDLKGLNDENISNKA